MACKQPFGGGNYLLLKPEEASLLDLVRFLFSSTLVNRSFIECPQELEFPEFRHRWILFISVVAQMALLASKNSLNRIGYKVEMWLNLLSSNGGFFRLLFNILRGSTFIWSINTIYLINICLSPYIYILNLFHHFMNIDINIVWFNLLRKFLSSSHVNWETHKFFFKKYFLV